MESTPKGKELPAVQPNKLHANAASFIRRFEESEPRMRQIVDELHKIAGGKEVRTMAAKQLILKTLDELREEEFDRFKWFLCTCASVPKSQLDKANRCEAVDRIVEKKDQRSVEVVKNILKKMDRNDLVEKLWSSDTGARGLQETPTSDWTL